MSTEERLGCPLCKAGVPRFEVTFIDRGEVYVCDNCGAFAKRAEDIKHHDTCTPGESKKWENYYNKGKESQC